MNYTNGITRMIVATSDRPVTLPPGRARLATRPAATGSPERCRIADCHHDIDIGFLQFLHLLRHLAQFARRTTGFVCQVLTERVAALRQRADEHRAIPAIGTHRRTRGQRTEAVNLACLSDSRRRSNKGSASKKCDEFAPSH